MVLRRRVGPEFSEGSAMRANCAFPPSPRAHDLVPSVDIRIIRGKWSIAHITSAAAGTNRTTDGE
jgi:hypothetical protein